jgi:DnaJ domain
MPAMFASSDGDRTRIAVTLTLASGAAMTGHVFAGMSGKLKDVVNHADRYLEFETREGTIIFILKDDIRAANAFDLPRPDQLERRLKDVTIFDPWRVLGVERTAGPAEIRTAYWARAKQYHPDKFVDTDAPKEVFDFMNAMFTRIHAAYKELLGEAAT